MAPSVLARRRKVFASGGGGGVEKIKWQLIIRYVFQEATSLLYIWKLSLNLARLFFKITQNPIISREQEPPSND